MRRLRPTFRRSRTVATRRARAGMRLAAGSLLACAPARAGAQAPGGSPAADVQEHRGFWIGFGLGPGRVALDCEANCGAVRPSRSWSSGSGGGFHFALGGTPRPNLLMGGELGATVRGSGLSTAGVAWLSFVNQWYPRQRSGLYVRGGVGLGGAVLEDEELGLLGERAVSTTGFTVQAGVGYDLRFGGRFGLSPFAEYVLVIAEGDEQRVGGRTYIGPTNPAALQAGLRFNWY